MIKNFRIKEHNDNVYCLTTVPEEKYLVSGSWDNTAKIWNYETKELKGSFEGHTGKICSVIYIQDTYFIASGG